MGYLAHLPPVAEEEFIRREIDMEEKRTENRNGSGKGSWKGVLIALIAGATAIICVLILSTSLVNYKKIYGSGGIQATGSASCDFESDLIVWSGVLTAEAAEAFPHTGRPLPKLIP